MSRPETDFESPEQQDPFILGYERLRSESKNDVLSFIKARTRKTQLLATRLRAFGIAKSYFPSDENITDISPRAVSLARGLLIGLYAGGLSMPYPARNHFYREFSKALDFEGPVFYGYHVDTTTLEEATAEQYQQLHQRVELPGQRDERLFSILSAGTGWAATMVSNYHAEFLAHHSPIALMFIQDPDKLSMQRDKIFLRSSVDVTAELFK